MARYYEWCGVFHHSLSQFKKSNTPSETQAPPNEGLGGGRVRKGACENKALAREIGLLAMYIYK